ncbi:MAG TPA: sensor domain-containing diguanylate cyclase [Rhodocyclaceae bacterium]|nr:sensor domain-containing diguanylate cyclase [Rhodocyclaceae bacterium]
MAQDKQHLPTLKTHFLMIAVVLTVLASVASWAVFHLIVQHVIEEWGTRVVQIQVRYESTRLLQPIEREIALARQMAQSGVLKRWSSREPDPKLHAEALIEMENYRLSFYDHSFFFARVDNGDYYYNNASNEFAGRELRYRLDPDNAADAWFYQLVEQRRDLHININPDDDLGVTKLWIDVLLREGDRILGVLGTGIDLETFLRDVVDIGQPGITSLFVDHYGAIQLIKDERLIDFASLVKPEGQKSTIDLLLDLPEERASVRTAMQRLRTEIKPGASHSRVHSEFVTSKGKRHLLGVAYLPTIGWYDMTLTDLEVVMPADRFMPVIGMFVLMSVLSLLLFNQALRRLILNPIAVLEVAMLRVRDGDLTPPRLPEAKGEIGRLIQHFKAMAEAIRHTTHTLEDRVRERTEDLNRLARIDSLTGLINRRGMTELLTAEIDRARRQKGGYGVLWVDVDEFKSINDTYGHAAGDLALALLANLLRENTRTYDHVARWGGDEFLVLLSPCDAETLRTTGERIRTGVERAVHARLATTLTVSIGACMAHDDDLEQLLQRADAALYAAKDAGRNTLRIAPDAAAGEAGAEVP